MPSGDAWPSMVSMPKNRESNEPSVGEPWIGLKNFSRASGTSPERTHVSRQPRCVAECRGGLGDGGETTLSDGQLRKIVPEAMGLPRENLRHTPGSTIVPDTAPPLSEPLNEKKNEAKGVIPRWDPSLGELDSREKG